MYQLFRDAFGTTVNGFITQKRLGLAQDYLKNSPALNVTEISARCGFPDYNYFIRFFKKRIGMTPLQYRKTYGGR